MACSITFFKLPFLFNLIMKSDVLYFQFKSYDFQCEMYQNFILQLHQSCSGLCNLIGIKLESNLSIKSNTIYVQFYDIGSVSVKYINFHTSTLSELQWLVQPLQGYGINQAL